MFVCKLGAEGNNVREEDDDDVYEGAGRLKEGVGIGGGWLGYFRGATNGNSPFAMSVAVAVAPPPQPLHS